MELLISLLSWQSIAVPAVAYCLTLAFYRLYLDPLAKFPGPKLAAITRYYEAYYDVVKKGQYTFRIADIHRQYGPIVRISPYELHINDPDYFEKLHRHEGRWNKYDWSVDAQNALGAIIFTPDHHEHKARRAPLNAYFSKSRVVRHQNMIIRKLEKLCGRIGEFAKAGRVIDLGAAISAFQRDASTEYVLGKDYNSLDQPDFSVGMTRIMHGGGRMWHLTKHIRWYGPAMLSIPKEFLIKSADPDTSNFMRYARDSEEDTAQLLKAAASYNPDDDTPRTIVHEIYDSNLPPKDKTIKRVFADVVSVTGAGFETTASLLRLVIYNVFSNTDILTRLRAELTEAAARSSSPDGSVPLQTLEKLPVSNGRFDGGPAIASRSQRTAPDRNLIYDKYRIPAGTPVGMTVLLMHTDERLYPDPHRFQPERWVDPEARKKAEKTYAPFSRVLPGQKCICLWLRSCKSLTLTFDGLTPKDHFKVVSDQFIVSTKGKAVLETRVSLRQR
ncbi:hypothetical protein QC764_123520 [Podospora pseudoanserina]|uniref:Cytochrome P450 n=1 Tax=Podospora pseudoanserina TaxID=2609844 RepID=A0ABR0IT56_9PEZI|nr:hypothetical protein QC764_123520 [Podospora pseudoanserina]